MSALQRIRGTAPVESQAPSQSQSSPVQQSGQPLISHIKSGDALLAETARNDAEIAQRREEQARTNYQDFYIGKDDAKAGKVHEVIILDERFDVCGLYEHNIMKNGNFVGTEICVKDYGHCPICASDNYSTLVLKLSILKLTPYTVRDGKHAGKVIPFQKQMLTIKSKWRAEWHEMAQNCIKQNGTLRGCYLRLKRDPNDQNASSNGKFQMIDVQVEVQGAMRTFQVQFDFVPEADLVEGFGSPEERDAQGKILKAANWDITPFDYTRVFAAPDLERLNTIYGKGPTVGSASDVAQSWNNQAASKPAPSGAAMLARSRLRGNAPPPVEAAKSAAEEFEQAPQGTPGTGVHVPPVVAKEGDDIPFG